MSLLDCQKHVIQSIRQPVSEGFSVYEHNIFSARLSAMQAMYPLSCELIGDEHFLLLCRNYINNTKQSDRDMNRYGEGLAQFLTQAQCSKYPNALKDSVRLEACKNRAYWAPKRRAFDTVWFSKLSEPLQYKQCLYLAADVSVLQTSLGQCFLVERIQRAANVTALDYNDYQFLKWLNEPIELMDLCSQNDTDLSQLSEHILKGRIEWTYNSYGG